MRGVCVAARALIALIALAALWAAPAQAGTEPLNIYIPEPPPPPGLPLPPPDGYFNGPCGVGIDSSGRVYVADHYHDVVDLFSPGLGYGGYISQSADPDPLGGPCGLALDSSDQLYVGDYHRGVTKSGAASPLDPGPSTGLAVDPATNHLYVDDRTHVSEYDSAGSLLRQIGAATLGEGYGVAVSGFPGDPDNASTAGDLYVPDAATSVVEVYDPAVDTADPVRSITGPPGGFSSLRDSAVAVDRASGDIYVVDDVQPGEAEQPRARVDVFDAADRYLGHLKYDTIDGSPTGLAVDNSSQPTQGRVYVTSGNTLDAGLYVYSPGAATNEDPLASVIVPTLLGGDAFFLNTTIGGPAPPPGGIPCDGDSCQVLPPDPTDPTLTTLLQGLGNPSPHYTHYRRGAAKRRSKHRHRKHHHRHKGRARAAGGARARAASAGQGAVSAPFAAAGGEGAIPAGGGGSTSVLMPGAAGFDAVAGAAAGGPATGAGSHPYSLEFGVGLDQSAGEADLRDLRIDLPPGLLVDPATVSPLCSDIAFNTPRVSQYDPDVTSGESCPDRSQVGTVAVDTAVGGGKTRRFGLFELDPASGAALRLGAAPFGHPLVFDAQIRSDVKGVYVSLTATDVPEALQAQSLKLALLGHALGRLPQRRTGQLPERGRADLPLVQELGRRAARQSPRRLPHSPHRVWQAPLLLCPGCRLGGGDRRNRDRGQSGLRRRSGAGRRLRFARLRSPRRGPVERFEGIVVLGLRLPPQRRRSGPGRSTHSVARPDPQDRRGVAERRNAQPVDRRRPSDLQPSPAGRRDRLQPTRRGLSQRIQDRRLQSPCPLLQRVAHRWDLHGRAPGPP